MSRPVLAYHLILTAYGFWLPNDPRGSWSDFVRAWELRRFGPAAVLVFAEYARFVQAYGQSIPLILWGRAFVEHPPAEVRLHLMFRALDELGISPEEAADFIDRYFHRYQGVQRYIAGCLSEARDAGVTRTLFGRIRQHPEINSKNGMRRRYTDRMCMS